MEYFFFFYYYVNPLRCVSPCEDGKQVGGVWVGNDALWLQNVAKSLKRAIQYTILPSVQIPIQIQYIYTNMSIYVDNYSLYRVVNVIGESVIKVNTIVM